MEIILYGNIVTHLYFGLNAAMRSSGSPKKAMALTIFTVIFNAILDPLFIFVLDLGIRGAAWATVIAQIAGMMIVLHHFNNQKRAFHFEKGIARLDWKVAGDSLTIGFGPFLMNSAACIVTLFINLQLKKYSGDLGIGAYGITNRIIFLFFMVCMGLNQGMQPIAGYNFGARQYSRVKEVFKKTAIMATVVTTSCFLVSVLIPDVIVSIFTKDQELIDLSARGLKILNLLWPVVGFQIIATNLFQSLGMVNKSIILSLSRQLLFLLPLLYMLPTYFGSDGVWYSFPIADTISSILTLILILRLFKKFNMLKDGDDPSILGSKL
jgi:putative MATE family efflux protein